MGCWGDTDFNQLLELKKKVKDFIETGLDNVCKDCAKEIAKRLLRKVEKRTPVGVYESETGMSGGNLRRSWKIGEIKNSAGVYTIEIINSADYASYVEYGHRQEPGRFVPAIGSRLKKSWVTGRFMLTITEKEIQTLAPKLLEKRLAEKLGEVFNDK